MGHDTFRQDQQKRGQIEMNAIIRTHRGETEEGSLHETLRSTDLFDDEAARETVSSDVEGEASQLFYTEPQESVNADATLPSATPFIIDEATAASSSTPRSPTPKGNGLPQGLYSHKPTHGSLLDPEVILAVQLILDEYRRCFSDSRDIATHRGLDLLALDGVLTQNGITHVKLHNFLMNFRKTMLTGLIIDGEAKIPTGHSRLRKGLKVFCVHPQYNQKAMQARDNRRQAQDKALQDRNARLSHEELNLARYFEAEVKTLESLNHGLQTTLQETQEDSDKVAKKYQDLSECHTALVATQQETLSLLRLRLHEADQKVIDADTALLDAKRELKQLQEDNARLRLKGASRAHKASTASMTMEAKSAMKTKPLAPGKEKENTCHAQTGTQTGSFWTRWFG